MAKTWTLAELQTALDRPVGQIAVANRAVANDLGPRPQARTRPAAAEAQRRLPELRKVETLLMERIKEALAPTGGGGEDGKPL